MKLKKTKKSKKLRGTNSHGHGSRKKWKGKGHSGGKGMAGTGKKADHKKTLVTKLYGNKYFGKKGITSKKTIRRKDKFINLKQIQNNLDSFIKKYGNKDIIDLRDYKILGEGELTEKLKIKAKEFTKTAEEKIKKAGGEIIKTEKKSDKKEIKEEDSKENLKNKNA